MTSGNFATRAATDFNSSVSIDFFSPPSPCLNNPFTFAIGFDAESERGGRGSITGGGDVGDSRVGLGGKGLCLLSGLGGGRSGLGTGLSGIGGRCLLARFVAEWELRICTSA